MPLSTLDHTGWSTEEDFSQSGGVSVRGSVGSVVGDIVGGNKTTYGLDAADLVALLEAKGLLRPAETGGLERRTVIMLAQRLKPNERLDFDQALTELERAVKVALDVIERGMRGTNEDDFVNQVLAQVAEQTREDDFDGGAQTLDEALAELDRQAAAQREAERRTRIALLEAGVRQHTLRRDPVAVASRIEMLVAACSPGDRPAWQPAFRQRYDWFQSDGETRGINFSLSVAIELADRMVATARDDRERGTAMMFHSNSLRILGARESGTARLEAAVAAYREVLELRTRDQSPADWAEAQACLGSALWRLGERERGTAKLEAAVSAYRAALAIRTRDTMPLEWAVTQTHLGTALSTLGERESGTGRLEEAVAAYRAALQEVTRDRAPLQWAGTQNDLGIALWTLGERESGTGRLEEAVAAYRAALKERTRERVPLDWAATQNNLGSALAALGVREDRTVRLEEAVVAYRAALEERARDRVPLDWAVTQNNLGNVLEALGACGGGAARLEEAVAAYTAALEIFVAADAAYYAEVCRQNLEGCQRSCGHRG